MGVCGCGVGLVRKQHIEGVQRDGENIYDLLNINIIWPFVKLIGVFASLINYMNVLN